MGKATKEEPAEYSPEEAPAYSLLDPHNSKAVGTLIELLQVAMAEDPSAFGLTIEQGCFGFLECSDATRCRHRDEIVEAMKAIAWERNAAELYVAIRLDEHGPRVELETMAIRLGITESSYHLGISGDWYIGIERSVPSSSHVLIVHQAVFRGKARKVLEIQVKRSRGPFLRSKKETRLRHGSGDRIFSKGAKPWACLAPADPPFTKTRKPRPPHAYRLF